MNWRYTFLVILLISVPAWSQTTPPATNSYLFPLFADGSSNGTTYRSSVRILPIATTTPSMTCTFSQTQTNFSFVGINGTSYPAGYSLNTFENMTASNPIILDGYQPLEVLTSQNTTQAALQTGYAAVSCPQPVHTELTIATFDSKGNKLSETAVEPATLGVSFEFVVDTRDGTSLAFSLVNNSAVVGEYQVIARDEYGRIAAAQVAPQINAYSQVSVFASQILNLPANFYGTIEVIGVNGGSSYAVGLQYTGSIFSIVIPTVRNAPIGSF